MSITYIPTTNFGAKDSLPANDPDKVIVGAEFTTEFIAIQTALGLAAPTSSPAFTGTSTYNNIAVTGTSTLDDADVSVLDVTGTATLADADVVTLDVTGTSTLVDLTVSGTFSASGYNNSDWDTAFGYGDHSAAGYLVATSGSYNNTDWDTAFGYGDHSVAGYAVESTSAEFTEVVLGDWTIKLSGTDLRFNYNGTDVFKIQSSGAVAGTGDVTANATL